MSVVSKNPFDLLGDDGEESPSVPTTKVAPASKKAEAPAAPKAVPGSQARGGAAAGGRGGRYPARGGPRNAPRPEASEPAAVDSEDLPAGFDGERVHNARKSNHAGRDAHTKGPRGSRPAKLTSGGHTSRGGGGGSRVPAQGGERRQFERRSGALPDSQKRVESGWGANEGSAELTAEVEGEKDAVAEENAPQTPAAEGEDGGWGATEPAAAEAAVEAEPEEPEEVQKSLDEYLAERASNALFGKKEARQVNSETVEGKAFVREALDDFFSGKEKTAAPKPKTVKKEKVFIEFDGQFASPAGSRPERGAGGERGRGGRGGRGGPRGGAGGVRGRGAPRGSARGGRGGFGGPNLNPTDETAFPALGA